MAEAKRFLKIQAKGHPNVRGSHHKTFELTTDPDITQAGTCILGVCAEVDESTLAGIRGRVEIELRSGEVTDRTTARINPLFLPGDPLIFRRDKRPKGRTLTIDTEHGADDFDRNLIAALQRPGAELEVTIREVRSDDEPGVLYLVGVPIGHPDDLSPRARRVLRWADMIACEDTRTSRPLLDEIGATKNRISYHDHNERDRADELREKLMSGHRIAVISDAGMPGIADPGHRLARVAHEAGAIVSPIAGPSAALLAMVASGMPTDAFAFEGFLPRNNKARRDALHRFSESRGSVVVYEAPHRAKETLEQIADVYGDRPISLSRELTKTNEEIRHGPAAELLADLEAGDRLRGEMTIVLPPRPAAAASEDAPEWLEPMCRALLENNVPKSAIAAAVRAAVGWPKKRGYAYVVALAE